MANAPDDSPTHVTKVPLTAEISTTPPAPPKDDAPEPPVRLERGGRPIADYELLDLLGRGGFGEVWKAVGPGGFPVALKFIRLGNRSSAVELRSLEVMKGQRHPHLLGLFGAWQRDGYLIIAMELGDKTLQDRLRAAMQGGESGIPRDELLEYLRDAARGLDHLNSLGIQHRDVKPQNLLLVGGGVKVADFGLAKLMEHDSNSNSGSMTPAYAPPEFFQGQICEQSDQYSLGATYCQLRGGRLPFGGNAVQLMCQHVSSAPDVSMVPPAERAVVARALAKKPEERWPSCRAFVEALALLPSEDVEGQTVSQVMGPMAPPPASITPRLSSHLGSEGGANSLARLPVNSSATVPVPGPKPSRARRTGLILLSLGGLGGVLAAVFLLRPSPAPVEPPGAKDPAVQGVAVKDADVKPPPVKDLAVKNPPVKDPPVKAKVNLPLQAGLELENGQPKTLKVHLDRQACPGPVHLTLEGLPAGVTAKPVTVPADTSDVDVELVVAAGARLASGTVRVIADAPEVVATGEVQVVVKPGRDFTDPAGVRLVLIPAGTFWMGVQPGDPVGDAFRHEIEIRPAFYLGACEVTVGQFRAFVRAAGHKTEAQQNGGGEGFDPQTGKSEIRADYSWDKVGWDQTDAHPVVNVSWNDAHAFCAWMSEKQGAHYRLPTEAEWEYACRGGADLHYCGGNDDASLKAFANVADASLPRRLPTVKWAAGWDDDFPFTAPVGKFQPNKFGLFDMHGNVWEWCADRYVKDYYRNSPRLNPRGPGTGTAYVVRGGSWYSQVTDCRSAKRFYLSRWNYQVGFRVVRER